MARRPRVYILCEICDKRITRSHVDMQCRACEQHYHGRCLPETEVGTPDTPNWLCKDCLQSPTSSESVDNLSFSSVGNETAPDPTTEEQQEPTDNAQSDSTLPEIPDLTLQEPTAAEDVTLPEDPLPSLDDISITRRLSSISSNTTRTMISDLQSSDEDTNGMDLRCTETMPNFDDSMEDFRNHLETIPTSGSESDVSRLTTSGFRYENNLIVESLSDIFGSVCFPGLDRVVNGEPEVDQADRDPCLAEQHDSPDSSHTSDDHQLPRTPGYDTSGCSDLGCQESANWTISAHYANLSECMYPRCHDSQDITFGAADQPAEEPIASSTQTSFDSSSVSSAEEHDTSSTASDSDSASERSDSSSTRPQRSQATLLVTDRFTDLVEMVPSKPQSGDMKVWMVPTDIWQQFLDYRASLQH